MFWRVGGLIFVSSSPDKLFVSTSPPSWYRGRRVGFGGLGSDFITDSLCKIATALPSAAATTSACFYLEKGGIPCVNCNIILPHIEIPTCQKSYGHCDIDCFNLSLGSLSIIMIRDITLYSCHLQYGCVGIPILRDNSLGICPFLPPCRLHLRRELH